MARLKGIVTFSPRLLIYAAAIVIACTPPHIFAQSSNQQSPDIPTLHTTAQLVIVDVSVTDNTGAPIKDLPKNAFHITESGKPQTISSFEEHDGTTPAKSSLTQKPQPGVFTNTTVTSGESASTVILLDLLNTPMQSQAFVRNQLLDYVKSAKPGAPIAIFALTSRLLMLQPFTSDLETLRRAIDRAHPEASPLLRNKLGGGPDIVATQTAGIEAQLSVSPEMADALQAFEDADIEVTAAETAGTTLHAMHQLALYLAGVPGRKNLIWFSSAFPLDLMPHGRTMAVPFIGSSAWEVEYRETADILARSRVAVYPLDARGLAINPGGSSTFEAHQTMQQVAEDTGGKAYINTNGLAQAVESVVSAGSSFYTLAYVPTDANAHGEFRSIHVTLENKPGFDLAYRRGYYAEPATSTPVASQRETVQAASLYLAPPATQIPFFARVLPLPADAPDISAPGEHTHPRRALDPGSFVRYTVEYSTDIRNLTILTNPESKRIAHIEYVIFIYDSQGRRIHSAAKSLHELWTPAQFLTTQQWGVRYLQQVDIPARGQYTLRLLVHDLTSNRIGAIDVPLATLPAPTPVAASLSKP